MSNGNFPSRVLIGVDDSIGQLRNTLADKTLPCIDADVLIECLIDVVQDVNARVSGDAVMERLYRHEVVVRRSYNEGIPWDVAELDDYVFAMENLRLRADRFTRDFRQQVQQLGVYQDGELPYEYDRLLDDSTIVLRTRRCRHVRPVLPRPGPESTTPLDSRCIRTFTTLRGIGQRCATSRICS